MRLCRINNSSDTNVRSHNPISHSVSKCCHMEEIPSSHCYITINIFISLWIKLI